jgi:hypothetical protein
MKLFKTTSYKRIVFYVVLLSFSMVGCATQTERQLETPVPIRTISPMPTNTSSPTATITPFPTQTLEPAMSMVDVLRADEYVLEDVVVFDKPWRYHYEIQSWGNTITNSRVNDRVSIVGQPFVTIFIDHAWLGELPKADITGEGDPDVIIYGWGARLANPVYIYNLGDELTRIFHVYRPSNYEPSGCPYDLFEFEDLDSDGVLEILTCDAVFGSFDCGASMGPMPILVYSYDSEAMQYSIVNPLFPEIYDEPIRKLTKLAEESSERQCIISDLVMNYFYSGQIEKGWTELYRIYRGDDIESFRQELENVLSFRRDLGRYVLLEDIEQK